MNNTDDFNDLERELAAVFARRAADITSAPQMDFSVPRVVPVPPGRAHHPAARTLAIAASVAAVLAVVGTSLIALNHADHDKNRVISPATSGATDVSPTPTPSPTSSACTIPMPTSWQAVIDHDALRVDQPVNEILSRDGKTGELLLRQSTMTTGQGAAIFDHQELALFDKQGHGTTIYTVPDADKAKVIEVAPSGAFTEHWIVFGLRGAQNLGGPTVLYAYDRESHALKQIAGEDPANGIYYSVPIVVGNTAWWLQGKWQDAKGVKVVGRDLGTGVDTAQRPAATERALDIGTSLATVGKYTVIASWAGQGYTLNEASPGDALPSAVVAAFANATTFWVDGDMLTWRKQSEPGAEYSWIAGAEKVQKLTLGGRPSATDQSERRVIANAGITVELPENLVYEGTVGGDVLISKHDGKLGPISLSRIGADLPKVTCN